MVETVHTVNNNQERVFAIGAGTAKILLSELGASVKHP